MGSRKANATFCNASTTYYSVRSTCTMSEDRMNNKNSRDIDPFATMEGFNAETNEKNNQNNDITRRINNNRNGHIRTSSNTTSVITKNDTQTKKKE
jgi:hypothetical protein